MCWAVGEEKLSKDHEVEKEDGDQAYGQTGKLDWRCWKTTVSKKGVTHGNGRRRAGEHQRRIAALPRKKRIAPTNVMHSRRYK